MSKWLYRWRVLSWVMICLIFSGRGLAAGPSTQADIHFDVPNPNCEKIQKILGVRDTGVDILGPLIGGVASLKEADGDKSDKEMDDLADALNKGSKPNVFSQLFYERFVLTNVPFEFEKEPGWPYGTWFERVDVVRALWNRAKNIQDNDAPRAQLYARAAFLLCGYGDFITSESGLWILRVREEDFIKILQLPDEQEKQLRQFYDDRDKRAAARSAATEPAMVALDKLITLPMDQKIPPELLKEIVTDLGKVRDFSDDEHLQEQLSAVTYGWELRNDAVKRNDTEAIGAADKFLGDWGNVAGKNTILKVWIIQAQKTVGEPRKDPRIVIRG